MSYQDMFQRYGQPSRDAEIRITGYLLSPKAITKAEDISHWDGSAARIIKECQAKIEALQDYRQALAARYGQLETMPYTDTLSIERYVNFEKRISFYIRITRLYSDGSEVDILTERYSGKERRKAFGRFNSLKKERPGIETVMDVEKRSWERR